MTFVESGTCPIGWIGSGSSCFIVECGNVGNYVHGHAQCVSYGATLATIEDVKESALVQWLGRDEFRQRKNCGTYKLSLIGLRTNDNGASLCYFFLSNNLIQLIEI